MEEEVIFKIELPDAPQSITTIENLTKANKALREERKKLDLDSAEGQKRAQQINQQLDKNTDLIKQNSSALEKQRLNVGNYSGALDKLVPGLGATANGFGAMTKAAWAFVANPIGAIIAALGLALAALTQYFRDNEAGQNKFNQLMNIGGAILGKFTDILSDLGEFIIDNLFKPLEFVADLLTRFIPGFDELIAKTREWLNLDRADLISNLEAENDVLERQLILDKARIQAKIAEAKLLAEDKNLSPKARAEALKEALALQDELSAKEEKFAANKLKIIQETNKQSKSNKEALKAEAEAEAALFLIQKDSADKKKEIFTKEQALRKEITDTINKQREAQEKLNLEVELYIKNFIEQLEAPKRAYEKALEEAEAAENAGENFARLIGLPTKEQFDGYLRDQVQQVQISESQKNKFFQESAKVKARIDAEGLANAQRTLAAGTSLFRQNTQAYKVIASGQAVVDTYAAANAALRNPPGPPYTIPFMLLTIAKGIQNLAQINNVKFAKGGIAVGPSHAQGGIPFSVGGRTHEMEGGEAIINKRSTSMFKSTLSAINQAGGGIPFANGGEVPISFSNIARQSEAQSLQRELVDAISQIRPIVTVEDINNGQNRVQVVEDRARVI